MPVLLRYPDTLRTLTLAIDWQSPLNETPSITRGLWTSPQGQVAYADEIVGSFNATSYMLQVQMSRMLELAKMLADEIQQKQATLVELHQAAAGSPDQQQVPDLLSRKMQGVVDQHLDEMTESLRAMQPGPLTYDPDATGEQGREAEGSLT